MERQLMDKLATFLSPSRLEHVAGTRDTAVKLARRPGLKRERVIMASLLHDCAREMTDEQLLGTARREHITVSDIEEALPVFLHGPVGAVMARKEFGINDLQVLKAIALHTTGSAKMGLLDKIIYIADKIEPARRYPGVEKLRRLAFSDLDACMQACLNRSIEFTLERGGLLHPEIVSARNAVITPEQPSTACGE